MKRSEWGLFAGASFLLAVAFPPYFLELIAITFLGGMGLLWRSLKGPERIRLAEFEKKFRVGYRKEQSGSPDEALAVYRSLIKEFKDSPLIIQIAKKQIEILSKTQKKSRGSPTKTRGRLTQRRRSNPGRVKR